MSANGASSQKEMQIGIMAECVQLMDICCIDLLGNCSKSNVEEAVEFGTEPLIPVSKPMKFHWISSSLEPAPMTSNIKFKPTITYDDCPRDLDILLIGGPMPSHRPAAADKFMKEAYAKTKTVMTTCVGSWWLASSGVLDGQNATINREALPMVKKLHPKIDWLDQRWVVDSKEGGELWTSGGAQAGIDMVATYVRRNFDPKLAEHACVIVDVEEKARGHKYST